MSIKIDKRYLVKMMKGPQVLIVGDSRKMKGGVSTVIKTIEQSYLWEKYKCKWVECQINASIPMKILYLLKGMIMAFFLIPQYDIIHFHGNPGRSIRVQFAIFLYACLWRKKIILHVHIGNQYTESVKDKVFAFCCRKADAIITLGEMWKKYIPVQDPSRVVAIYNPAPAISTPQSSQKYFLFAAWLSMRYKAYDTLIKGWAIAARNHPDWRLVICGGGEVDNLKKFIKDENVESSVDFLGWVEGDDKHQLFSHAYGYIMTSVQEGLPMSVLEALSEGVPVITTPVGTLPELLVANESALMFDFRDAKGLAQCIEQLIEDDVLRKKLIANGQHLVDTTLSKERFAEEIDKLYQSLL